VRTQHKILASLTLLVPVSGILALLTGSSDTGINELWPYLSGDSEPLTETIFTLRAERALDGFIVGALLSMAGALLQVLLRNPLAEPYILGISGGAGVVTLAALLLGLSSSWTPLTAFAGALLSTLLVFSISFSNGNWTTERLLLTGVVIAAGWSAVISFLLTISSQQQMQGMLLPHSHWRHSIIADIHFQLDDFQAAQFTGTRPATGSCARRKYSTTTHNNIHTGSGNDGHRRQHGWQHWLCRPDHSPRTTLARPARLPLIAACCGPYWWKFSDTRRYARSHPDSTPADTSRCRYRLAGCTCFFVLAAKAV
jgi:hypothetical protein